MKFLKYLLGLVLLLALVVFGGALLLSPDYAVSRSTLVQATPARVYALLDSPQGWASWGVWYRRDPQMKVTESGPASGVGAAWRWTSTSQGNGAMALTEAQPGQRVAYTLAMEGMDPSAGDMTLSPEGSGTRVTWRMHGSMGSLVHRWFSLFMDKLVGPDFDEGLANLKALAEKG